MLAAPSAWWWFRNVSKSTETSMQALPCSPFSSSGESPEELSRPQTSNLVWTETKAETWRSWWFPEWSSVWSRHTDQLRCGHCVWEDPITVLKTLLCGSCYWLTAELKAAVVLGFPPFSHVKQTQRVSFVFCSQSALYFSAPFWLMAHPTTILLFSIRKNRSQVLA